MNVIKADLRECLPKEGQESICFLFFYTVIPCSSCLCQVHRLDRDSSGLLLLGRKKESIVRLHWLFRNINLAKTSSQVHKLCLFSDYRKPREILKQNGLIDQSKGDKELP